MYTVIITLIILFSLKLIETLFAKYIHQRMNGQNTHQNLNENFKTIPLTRHLFQCDFYSRDVCKKE